MTPDEFKQLGTYARGLWPAWEPTSDQMEAWFAALKHRTLADVKAALLGGYTASRWREPNLPDVLEALPKTHANYASAPADPERIEREYEAHRRLLQQRLGLPAVTPRRTAPLKEQAEILREAAQRSRRMAGDLQQAFDATVAQWEAQRKTLQAAIDEVRKFASETLAQADALSLEMKAAALAADETLILETPAGDPHGT